MQKQKHYFANKGSSSQGYGFPGGHVWMWELDCGESWALKNWCFWTVVLEKTLESPLDCMQIQPVHPKGDQPWVFIGRTDVEAETPILGPPAAKSWLIWKDPVAGKDWGQEEKGMTEDEMSGWHHRLNGREFEWIPGVGDVQGGLVCRGSWGRKELDMTESNWVTELNWTEEWLRYILSLIPCAVQQALVVYQPTYTICIFKSQTPSPFLSVPPPPPLATTVCSLCLWVCFCLIDTLICVIF